MFREQHLLRSNRPDKSRGRGAAFVWVSSLAFVTYLGVAVAAGRQDFEPGSVALPEDSATLTPGGWGSPLRGRASWYGPGFHGSPTASGETYDMNDLTAAHRTLPLGSRALVQNLENGRTVVVKINDRGPYFGDRVLDLSYGAAHELGIVNPGTARVQITPL